MPVDCDGKNVPFVLSSFDGSLRIRNGQLVLTQALYDPWCNRHEACFVLDTHACEGKERGMTDLKNVLTFGNMK